MIMIISVNNELEKSFSEEAESVEKKSFRFQCDECSYKNNFEKELNQHKRMKHNIIQTEATDDYETEDSDISYLVEKMN